MGVRDMRSVCSMSMRALPDLTIRFCFDFSFSGSFSVHHHLRQLYPARDHVSLSRSASDSVALRTRKLVTGRLILARVPNCLRSYHFEPAWKLSLLIAQCVKGIQMAQLLQRDERHHRAWSPARYVLRSARMRTRNRPRQTNRKVYHRRNQLQGSRDRRHEDRQFIHQVLHETPLCPAMLRQ